MANLVKKIEEQVSSLTETDLRTFRSWFMQFDAANWDEQFSCDANAGKLNNLAAEALEQYNNGRCKRL
jgi:hypothetical protein